MQPTRTMVIAERALLHRLQGGCQVPIAAHATVNGSEIVLDGLVASVDGKEVIRDRVHGTTADPHAAGIQLAERLIGRGAEQNSSRDLRDGVMTTGRQGIVYLVGAGPGDPGLLT